MLSTHARTQALCGDLFNRGDQLWAFANYAGVPPTNNRAEQVLSRAVIWRELSFGTHSHSGSRFVETLLTIIETGRQRHCHVIDFLTTTLEAQNHNTPAPLLLTNTGV